MRLGSRLLVVVIVAITTLGGPPATVAAPASPAGMALTVHGQSTVIRSDTDTSAPLRMRDPVYVRDRVGTSEKSMVRLLLGGKALVTLRESSVVTITDTPERSAVTLREGKLALGLAKTMMRPGDVVEVRTPNAVAGIRGSFLVAETTTVNGVVQTVFTALHVSTPIIVTFANNNVPTPLGVNQTVTVRGLGAAAVIGPVRDLTRQEIERAAAVSSAPSLTGRDVQAPPGFFDGLLLPWTRPTVQHAVEVPRSFTVSAPTRDESPRVAPPVVPPIVPPVTPPVVDPPATPPPFTPPPVAGPPPFTPPPVVGPPPLTPPPVSPPPVAGPPPLTPPPVVIPPALPPPPPPVVLPPPPVGLPPAVRGLDRANQVAGENGAAGRTNAAGRGNH